VATVTTSSRPLWFGPPARPLFGRVYLPADGVARAGVLLCPPFDLEAQEVALAYRLLAEDLRERRFAVLHFDYDGTGDSAGRDGDPDRVRAWQESIVEAAKFLRSGGAIHVFVIGMRLGATLAASVAARCAVDGLVLWDPCGSGRSYLREQALLRTVHAADQGAAPATEPPDATGQVETLGRVYGPETVAEMSRLNIEGVPTPLARSVLAVLRAERRPRPSLIERLSQENVEFANSAGQDELLSAWTVRSVVPRAAIATIAGWLDRVATTAVSPVHVPGREAASLKGPSHKTVVERLEVSHRLGLFMISTEPETPVSTRTIVLLNAGRTDHTGPARLWVDLARQWAGAGLRVVRADLSGLGGSPPHPGQYGDRAYPDGAVEDVRDIAESVSPDDPSDVVLVGLCSGGYHSAMAALEMPVAAVVAINPGFPSGGRTPRDDDLRALAERGKPAAPSPGTPGLLRARAVTTAWLRRRIPGLHAAFKRRAGAANELKYWFLNRTPGRTRPVMLFKRLVRTGTSTLVIFRPYEADLFGKGDRGALRRLQRAGNFSTAVVDESDHTLYLQRSRREIVPLLTRYVLGAAKHSPSIMRDEEADGHAAGAHAALAEL
jgi:alpha-beta hydrolase superfamily lysophospholipase